MPEGRPLRPRGKAAANGSSSNGSTRPSYLDVPQDSLGTYLKVIRQAPAALRMERQWTKGMSGRIAPALLTLEADVGHSFPILASLHHGRGVRAIATVPRDNLDPEPSTLGLRAKCLVGLVYARVVGNEVLTSEAIQLALTLVPDMDHPLLTAVGRFATASPETVTLPPQLSSVEAAVVMLAKVGAPSPSRSTRSALRRRRVRCRRPRSWRWWSGCRYSRRYTGSTSTTTSAAHLLNRLLHRIPVPAAPTPRAAGEQAQMEEQARPQTVTEPRMWNHTRTGGTPARYCQ